MATIESYHDVLVRPLITEKSTRLLELGQYSFEVHREANRRSLKVIAPIRLQGDRKVQLAGLPFASHHYRRRERQLDRRLLDLP